MGPTRLRGEQRRSWRVRLRGYSRALVAGLTGRSGPLSPELVCLLCQSGRPPMLPPGHPERITWGVPLSADESGLWSQLIRGSR
jgi:hypothetical protein